MSTHACWNVVGNQRILWTRVAQMRDERVVVFRCSLTVTDGNHVMVTDQIGIICGEDSGNYLLRQVPNFLVDTEWS